MSAHRFVSGRRRFGDGWIDPEAIPSAFTATRDEFAAREFAAEHPAAEPEPSPLDSVAAEAPHRD